jgi:hypothetical protein
MFVKYTTHKGTCIKNILNTMQKNYKMGRRWERHNQRT